MSATQAGYWYLASYPKSGNTWCLKKIPELIHWICTRSGITLLVSRGGGRNYVTTPNPPLGNTN